MSKAGQCYHHPLGRAGPMPDLYFYTAFERLGVFAAALMSKLPCKLKLEMGLLRYVGMNKCFKFIVFTFVIISMISSQANAAEEFSCSSTRGLLHLAEYLVCELNPQLRACENLAVELTGKAMTTAGKQRIQMRLKAAKEKYFANIAKLKSPKLSKAEIQSGSNDAWLLIAAQFEKAGPLDSEFTDAATRSLFHKWKEDRPEIPDSVAHEFAMEMIKKAAENVRDEIIHAAVNSLIEKVDPAMWLLIPSLLRVAGVKLAGMMDGVIFGAIMEAVHGTPTACDEMQDGSINRVAVSKMGGFTSECEVVYEANENVLRFLDAPQGAQLQSMKNRSVCNFYDTFYNMHLDRPVFTGLTCSGDQGFKLQFKDESETKFMLQGVYLGEKYLKQINVFRNGGGLGPIQFDAQGNPIYGVTNENRDFYRHMKLYITEAIDCCNSNPSDFAVCSKALSSGTQL